MGLTYQSTGRLTNREMFHQGQGDSDNPVVALAGNPNTGKSTVFNALTGLRQHTGNWPGKTVLHARGSFIHAGIRYTLVDLPGTYSLLANSPEEEVARDFICFGRPRATIVVVDATCLERNLNLVLQITEITSRVVVCLNLMDEARRKEIRINVEKLSSMLGVPVVATAARSGEGLSQLVEVVSAVVGEQINPVPVPVRYPPAIKEAIARLEPKIRALLGQDINARWVALRIMDGDVQLLQAMQKVWGAGNITSMEEALP